MPRLWERLANVEARVRAAVTPPPDYRDGRQAAPLEIADGNPRLVLTAIVAPDGSFTVQRDWFNTGPEGAFQLWETVRAAMMDDYLAFKRETQQ